MFDMKSLLGSFGSSGPNENPGLLGRFGNAATQLNKDPRFLNATGQFGNIDPQTLDLIMRMMQQQQGQQPLQPMAGLNNFFEGYR